MQTAVHGSAVVILIAKILPQRLLLIFRHVTLITDLPGIYSMSPYSSEELVSRDFVLGAGPKGMINIVDSSISSSFLSSASRSRIS